MLAWLGKPLRRAGLGSVAVVAACLPIAAHADARSLYELTYALSSEVGLNLDGYGASQPLRPSFSSDGFGAGNGPYQLGLRSRSVPSLSDPTQLDQGLDVTGSYLRRLGSTGFGYSFDLGLGLYVAEAGTHGATLDSNTLEVGGGSSLMLGDLSTGPTFETGNLSSRVRVGVRTPALGDASGLNPSFYGHRGDLSRGAGFVSLDGRYRFANQTEMSLSLFYDDANLLTLRDRPTDGTEGRVGGGLQPVIGFEMGLNF